MKLKLCQKYNKYLAVNDSNPLLCLIISIIMA